MSYLYVNFHGKSLLHCNIVLHVQYITAMQLVRVGMDWRSTAGSVDAWSVRRSSALALPMDHGLND